MINNLIFLGAPGVGKGTVAQVIAKEYGFVHLSTGEIFREAIRNETDLGKQLKNIVEQGLYVPDEITNAIVENKIKELNSKNQKFILDGYPRTINQAEFLEKLENHNISSAILLEAPKDVIIQRLSKRRYCPLCKTTYHLEFKPSKKGLNCENDDELLLQREDDQEDAIIKRLEVYEEKTKVLIDFYKNKNILKTFEAIDTPENLAKNIFTSLK